MKGIIKQENVKVITIVHQKSDKDPNIQWDTALVTQGLDSYKINIKKDALPRFKEGHTGTIVCSCSEIDDWGKTKLQAIDFLDYKKEN